MNDNYLLAENKLLKEKEKAYKLLLKQLLPYIDIVQYYDKYITNNVYNTLRVNNGITENEFMLNESEVEILENLRKEIYESKYAK